MSETIYASLLRLFPASFREAHGDAALQLFRDRFRDERGFFPRLRLWLDLLFDLASSLPREYRRLRPAFVDASAHYRSDGIPSFTTLKDEPLRPEALLFGCVLAVAALGGFVLLFNHARDNGTFSISSSQAHRSANSGAAVPRNRATHAAAAAQPSASGPFQASAQGPASEILESIAARHSRELELGAAERQRVINALIKNLRQHYADPGAASKMADMLSTREKSGAYSAITSGRTFASVLTEQMRNTSQDLYLMVIYNASAIPTSGPSAGTFHRLNQRFAIFIPEARVRAGGASQP